MGQPAGTLPAATSVAAATTATATVTCRTVAIAAATTAAAADMAGAEAGPGTGLRRREAVELIDEATGNAEHGVEREKQRQRLRRFRIDPVALAGQPPGALDAILSVGW